MCDFPCESYALWAVLVLFLLLAWTCFIAVWHAACVVCVMCAFIAGILGWLVSGFY